MPRINTRVAAIAATLASALVVASCSGDATDDTVVETTPASSTDEFGYQVNESLVTTNASSSQGASTNAQLLASRLYPAAFVGGPSGQMIPNTDLISAQPLPGPTQRVQYTVTDGARFSDGDPVTCVDFQLAYVSSVMTDLFDSHVPLMGQVTEFHCTPGAKEFTVVFGEGQGARWRELFGSGTVLPAHAIAREAGIDEAGLAAAMNDQDTSVLAGVADVWNTGFDLDNFNPALQVSSGPFVVEEVGDAGEVTLVRNPEYPGDPANLEKLVIWPREADTDRLVAEGALKVADAPTSDPSWVNRDDPMNRYVVDSVVGKLTESLRMSDVGVLSSTWNRQAFAACIDRRAVAGESSRMSGVEVPPVTLHTVTHNDPIHYQLDDIGNSHLEPDYATAGGLWGTTIRIGYQGPDARKAAMVQAIADSCAQAGVTVEDASADGSTLADLSSDAPTIDAYLWAIDPNREYGTVSASVQETDRLRQEEEQMWQELPSIPLSAEPRTFVRDDNVSNVVVYSGLTGIGWNMDRWQTTSE